MLEVDLICERIFPNAQSRKPILGRNDLKGDE